VASLPPPPLPQAEIITKQMEFKTKKNNAGLFIASIPYFKI
jgi:hypothetical protein